MLSEPVILVSRNTKTIRDLLVELHYPVLNLEGNKYIHIDVSAKSAISSDYKPYYKHYKVANKSLKDILPIIQLGDREYQISIIKAIKECV